MIMMTITIMIMIVIYSQLNGSAKQHNTGHRERRGPGRHDLRAGAGAAWKIATYHVCVYIYICIYIYIYI